MARASISVQMYMDTEVDDAGKNAQRKEPKSVEDGKFYKKVSLDFECTKCGRNCPVICEWAGIMREYSPLH